MQIRERIELRQIIFASILALGTVSQAAVEGTANPTSPPVNTARLPGSRDPLPLTAERAFPNLKFKLPLLLTHAGDGSNRLFVVEQDGRIHVFENRQDVKQTKIFLDIRERVARSGWEEGLLGLAFHPQFKTNGQFFVCYSERPGSTASIVSRFRVSPDDPNSADPDSEERILRVKQPHANHNGGSIRFGPDGMLYIGLGDGGSQFDPHGNGQNLNTLLAKILRIDVDRKDAGKAYAIPPDNPFVNSKKPARGEIWAYGLRNPWQLSFDRKTGQLWIGDVGQDKWEEVDLIVRGGNYGWNLREGRHPLRPGGPKEPPAGLIEPVWEYGHHLGQSITGGLVYRGPSLPKFVGHYFFGDFVTGNMWALTYDGRRTDCQLVARTKVNVTAFGEDAAGEMYLTAYDGRIYQLRPRKEE